MSTAKTVKRRTPTPVKRLRPPPRILTEDVLRKFSKRSLASMLNITRQAIGHWGRYMPEHHAETLREHAPAWRRRKDFDLSLYRARRPE